MDCSSFSSSSVSVRFLGATELGRDILSGRLFMGFVNKPIWGGGALLKSKFRRASGASAARLRGRFGGVEEGIYIRITNTAAPRELPATRAISARDKPVPGINGVALYWVCSQLFRYALIYGYPLIKPKRRRC